VEVEDTSFLPELKSPAAGEKAALDDKASISIVIDERKRLNEATTRIAVAVVGIAAVDILIICCRSSLLDDRFEDWMFSLLLLLLLLSPSFRNSFLLLVCCNNSLYCSNDLLDQKMCTK
jgi:hypothetical protein